MTSIVVLSGVSGSGKTTAMKLFEDLGYFCVDNLPADLLNTFVELCNNSQKAINRVAFVVDIREGVFLENAPYALKKLKRDYEGVQIIYLDSSDHILIQRYKETKRKHPLDSEGDIGKGIAKERRLLEPIKELADHIIDTSSFNTYQLREILKEFHGGSTQNRMYINFVSFGYKHGFPSEADLVFDVRFLPNPYYIEKLKPLSGLDPEVVEFVNSHEDTGKFLKKLVDILEFLIPRYEREGKSYLTVAFGCTGGVHRSVVLTEQIARHFKRYLPNVRHRDILKG